MNSQQKTKRLTQVRNKIRALNYSLQTEKTDAYWIRKFLYPINVFQVSIFK
ncbi:hypothetical protein ABVT42_09095 [Aliikangiella sp. GXAS 306]|uniref:Uncharacterized protein n=1 Tax=Aliikangiella maris TaxID=3162458 RepID=A0ABV3MN45_9GAMM